MKFTVVGNGNYYMKTFIISQQIVEIHTCREAAETCGTY